MPTPLRGSEFRPSDLDPAAFSTETSRRWDLPSPQERLAPHHSTRNSGHSPTRRLYPWHWRAAAKRGTEPLWTRDTVVEKGGPGPWDGDRTAEEYSARPAAVFCRIPGADCRALSRLCAHSWLGHRRSPLNYASALLGLMRHEPPEVHSFPSSRAAAASCGGGERLRLRARHRGETRSERRSREVVEKTRGRVQ